MDKLVRSDYEYDANSLGCVTLIQIANDGMAKNGIAPDKASAILKRAMLLWGREIQGGNAQLLSLKDLWIVMDVVLKSFMIIMLICLCCPLMAESANVGVTGKSLEFSEEVKSLMKWEGPKSAKLDIYISKNREKRGREDRSTPAHPRYGNENAAHVDAIAKAIKDNKVTVAATYTEQFEHFQQTGNVKTTKEVDIRHKSLDGILDIIGYKPFQQIIPKIIVGQIHAVEKEVVDTEKKIEDGFRHGINETERIADQIYNATLKIWYKTENAAEVGSTFLLKIAYGFGSIVECILYWIHEFFVILPKSPGTFMVRHYILMAFVGISMLLFSVYVWRKTKGLRNWISERKFLAVISRKIRDLTCTAAICGMSPFVRFRNWNIDRKKRIHKERLDFLERENMIMMTNAEEIPEYTESVSHIRMDEKGPYMLYDNHKVYFAKGTDVATFVNLSGIARDRYPAIGKKESIIAKSKFYKAEKFPGFQGTFEIGGQVIGHFSRIKYDGRSCLITAYHVLKNNMGASISMCGKTKKIEFALVKTSVISWSPTSMFDFIVLEVADFVFSLLELSIGSISPGVSVGTPISIYQYAHNNKDMPCFTTGVVCRSQKPWHIQYGASTIVSSGAAVLDQKGRIVAIHVEEGASGITNVGIIPPIFRSRKESVVNNDVMAQQRDFVVAGEEELDYNELRGFEDLDFDTGEFSDITIGKYVYYENTDPDAAIGTNFKDGDRRKNWFEEVDEALADSDAREEKQLRVLRLQAAAMVAPGHINRQIKGGRFRKESPWTCSKCFTLHLKRGFTCVKCGYALVKISNAKIPSDYPTPQKMEAIKEVLEPIPVEVQEIITKIVQKTESKEAKEASLAIKVADVIDQATDYSKKEANGDVVCISMSTPAVDLSPEEPIREIQSDRAIPTSREVQAIYPELFAPEEDEEIPYGDSVTASLDSMTRKVKMSKRDAQFLRTLTCRTLKGTQFGVRLIGDQLVICELKFTSEIVGNALVCDVSTETVPICKIETVKADNTKTRRNARRAAAKVARAVEKSAAAVVAEPTPSKAEEPIKKVVKKSKTVKAKDDKSQLTVVEEKDEKSQSTALITEIKVPEKQVSFVESTIPKPPGGFAKRPTEPATIGTPYKVNVGFVQKQKVKSKKESGPTVTINQLKYMVEKGQEIVDRFENKGRSYKDVVVEKPAKLAIESAPVALNMNASTQATKSGASTSSGKPMKSSLKRVPELVEPTSSSRIVEPGSIPNNGMLQSQSTLSSTNTVGQIEEPKLRK